MNESERLALAEEVARKAEADWRAMRDQSARLSARLERVENAAREFAAAWDQAHSFEIANLPSSVRIAAAKLRETITDESGQMARPQFLGASIDPIGGPGTSIVELPPTQQ